MRFAHIAILLLIAASLTGCKRSANAPPPLNSHWQMRGSRSNCSATCDSWIGGEIAFAFFLRETTATPAGPSARGVGYLKVSGDGYTRREDFLLDGMDLPVEFTSATPDVIRVGDAEYKLAAGRIFLCGVENGKLMVRQVAVPVQEDGKAMQDMKGIADEEPIKGFLSVTATQPAGQGT